MGLFRESEGINIRNTKDRIRHAISFEVIGVILVTPLAAWLFNQPIFDIGVVTLVGVAIGAVWNYVFNLLFDHAMLRMFGFVRKTIPIRIAHAILFEIGFLLISVPFIVWYLQITFLQALALDVSISLFFLLYTFIFNWAYDLLFPVPLSNVKAG